MGSTLSRWQKLYDRKKTGIVYGRYPAAHHPYGHGLPGYEEVEEGRKIPDLDASEEINACSIVAPIEVDGKKKTGW